MAENHQAASFHPPLRDPPVRYTVRFPEPRTHYLSVEAMLPTECSAEVEVFMPVWTPGSYLVREYARNIEGISVSSPDGSALPFCKSSKNRWRIETSGAAEIRFAYSLYCREMSVRSNWVEESFALINGAPTFVAMAGCLARPHEVRLELAPGWQTAVTGLPRADIASHTYLAKNYDVLVDSPILCGNPAVYAFEVDGIPHLLANDNEAGVWDGPRSAADAASLVRRHREMWGTLPYRTFVFLNLLTESRGGLEHGNSVCLMTSRWATRSRHGYLGWLNLVSHEFFHVWNIKRLRPVELGPFDYEKENYTRSLWIAEGITDYYAPLTVRRAGLSNTEEYLESLSETINKLQSTPGRLVQSAEQSSWDTWIKLYRPDENSANTSISYYTKGAVIGWLLDARIRRTTAGGRSLDHLMRLAFQRFSEECGFTGDQFKALAGEVAGAPLDEFFQHAVESAKELDYTEALDWFGLQFKPPDTEKAKAGTSDRAHLGAETRIDNGRLIVTRVTRDAPAWRSGLSPEDEIIAIDDVRVRPEHISRRLECYHPGDGISVLVARRDLLMKVDLILACEPRHWQLEIRPDATEAQKNNLAGWIGL
jgi:predicted metalloprotease with PDZ domain